MKDLHVWAIVFAILANARDDWMGSVLGAYAVIALAIDLYRTKRDQQQAGAQ